MEPAQNSDVFRCKQHRGQDRLRSTAADKPVYIAAGLINGFLKAYDIDCRERRGVCRISVGKPEGKRPLGRPGRRWEDNIKMDLQEILYFAERTSLYNVW